MKFLIDAQLPPGLARTFVDAGHDAQHVFDIGLHTATDRAILEFATRNSAIIVTKDQDFAVRRLSGAHGTPVVWIRVGNCSRGELVRWFMPLLPQIAALIDSGEVVIELR